jgi:predicted phage baseplate assembly protein
VSINANVAPATHGESVSEILGSGDASRPDQRFALKQLPLTHVRADTPSGRRSTLAVRVSESLWEERRTLYGAGPLDRLHTTETGDDSRTAVVFGDGIEGARLPTGDHNVRATYRKGLGAAGNVRAGALTTLLSGPLGVAGVNNPEPATGGEDAEALGAARENAPLTVLTLDRAVSLRDYEDFSRGFAGIAKAHATWVTTGPLRGVLLTVAGPEGASIDPSQPTHASLVGALRRFGDPLVRTIVASYQRATFRLSAAVKVAADAESATVLAGVRAALLAAFSFGARGFGQAVSIDEVAAVTHGVRGVVAVDVNVLRRSDQASTPAVRPRLFAALPTVTAAGFTPAELLTIDSAALELEVLA